MRHFSHVVTVLHVAPEPRLARVLHSKPKVKYVSMDIDLRSTAISVAMDITRLGFLDYSFDLVICNHVLEHVSDEQSALTELYRVLRPKGWAILQVPFSPLLDRTIEDPLIRSAEDRAEAYGQPDHVRLYGLDYPSRIQQAGFSITVIQAEQVAGQQAISEYSLIQDEKLFIANRI